MSNTAQMTFTFNTSAVEDVTPSVGKGPEVLDNGLTISTMFGATLKSSASTAVQERGTSFLLNGNTLTISFNPATGIQTQIASDTITSVIYNNLVVDHAAADRPSRAREVAVDADRHCRRSQCYM